jgi:thiopurine S-methyltransferase
MQAGFWHNKWEKNQIGFHLSEANPLLVRYLSALNLKQGSRIFLPLCGKSLDIAWLLARGYQVAGAELSAIAVEDLFHSLNLTPKITQKNKITHYSALNIDMFVGDIFDVTPRMLGKIDAIYDRAALVALPGEMRKKYSVHLITLTQLAPQLLICFEYDENLHAGPPFSVDADEVKAHYQASYDLMLLASEKVDGGLKGKCSATEHVWRLKPLDLVS